MPPESRRSRTNTWDVVDLNSNQDVFVDDSIGTSISSGSRVTEPSNPSATTSWVERQAFQPSRVFIECRKQHQHWLQLRVRHQRANRKLKRQYPTRPFERRLCPPKLLLPQSQSLIMEGKNRENPDTLLLTDALNRHSFEVGKPSSKSKSIIFRNIPEPR